MVIGREQSQDMAQEEEKKETDEEVKEEPGEDQSQLEFDGVDKYDSGNVRSAEDLINETF